MVKSSRKCWQSNLGISCRLRVKPTFEAEKFFDIDVCPRFSSSVPFLSFQFISFLFMGSASSAGFVTSHHLGSCAGDGAVNSDTMLLAYWIKPSCTILARVFSVATFERVYIQRKPAWRITKDAANSQQLFGGYRRHKIHEDTLF